MGVAVRMAVLEALARHLPQRDETRMSRRPIALRQRPPRRPARGLDERGARARRDGRHRRRRRGVAAPARPRAPRSSTARGAGAGARASSTCASSSASPAPSIARRSRPASEAAAAGGVTTHRLMPDTDPVDRRPGDRRLRAAPRPRHGDRQRPSRRRRSPRASHGREMTEIGLLQEAGAVAFTDGAHAIANAQVMRRALTYARDFGALVVHARRGCRPRRRRRHERGRVRHAARPCRHPARGRDRSCSSATSASSR